MPAEEHPRYDLEDKTDDHSFDVLARSFADGTLSRQRALKLIGAAILGGALPLFAFLSGDAEDAEAKGKAKGKGKGKGKRKKKKKCGEHNCKGCCDAFGVCHPGVHNQACGNSGGPCRVCLHGTFCGPFQGIFTCLTPNP